jgi:broad specificity phosphatase PhoE
MAKIYLVRHAEAATDWGSHDPDPGLSEKGRAQADAMADRLAPLGPLPLRTSPLRRARETAAALEKRWSTMALVDPGVGEVPSPAPDESAGDRRDWLRTAMASTWADLGPRWQSWRTMVVELLLGIGEDTVVVSHFVLINAALGRASGRDEVLVTPVGNASVTVFDNGDQELKVLDISGRSGEIGTVL